MEDERVRGMQIVLGFRWLGTLQEREKRVRGESLFCENWKGVS